MEIVIKNKELLGPLGTVAGVAADKMTMPILGYLCFRTKNNRMSLVGSDTEVEITSHLTLDRESPDMEGTVPARKFLNICRTFSEDSDIRLTYEGETMKLLCEDSMFSLSTLPASDFPRMEVPDEDDKKLRVSFPASELRARMHNVLSCMAVNDVRYYLNGMLFDFASESLSLVATDGHRLALSKKKIEQANSEKTKCIVPREGVMQLMRLIGGLDEDVELVFYSNLVQMITKDFSFNCKLIDASFPDYVRVIPEDLPHKIVLESAPLTGALRRCSFLSSAGNRVQKVEFKMESGVFNIFASNMEREKVEEKLTVQYDGEPLTINFNVQYIMDILGTMPGAAVELSLNDGNSSARLCRAGEENELFVVMPMKA